MSLNLFVDLLREWIWGWPLIVFIVVSGIYLTLAFNFVQFRYFFTSWRYVFTPEKGAGKENYISPFQAFVNTLSASIGNGSLNGMATAMYWGGPGAALWMFVLGFFNMAIRFAEVFASTTFTERSAMGAMRGGPMVYLKQVPGGTFLPSIYAFFCLMLALITGNGMQCKSITTGIFKMTCISPYAIAIVLFCLLLYIMFGGAQRIINVSDRIIPVKVGLFVLATAIVLIFNAANIVWALKTIVYAAFDPQAIVGGFMGHTVQNALRFGMARNLNATEVGLGTSAILFGSTGSNNPWRSGVMSMASTFISNYIVCFALMVVFMVTGQWNSGASDITMTIAAYSSVFGMCGGWIVTFLSITFGLGTLVAYAYIGRECWMFLTNGKYELVYVLIYCLMALLGSLVDGGVMWNAIDIVNAGLVLSNVFGLVVLAHRIRPAVMAAMTKKVE